MEFCRVCKVVVKNGDQDINQCIHLWNANDKGGDKYKVEYVYIDCADGYFCDLETKRYREFCKKNSIRVDSKILTKIRNNEEFNVCIRKKT